MPVCRALSLQQISLWYYSYNVPTFHVLLFFILYQAFFFNFLRQNHYIHASGALPYPNKAQFHINYYTRHYFICFLLVLSRMAWLFFFIFISWAIMTGQFVLDLIFTRLNLILSFVCVCVCVCVHSQTCSLPVIFLLTLPAVSCFALYQAQFNHKN